VYHFFNPTTKRIKSYVKDTTYFLKLISELGEIPEGALLVTMDVEALYPNIPNKEGMEAAKLALDESRKGTNVRPTNAALMRLLNLVLKRNNFQFNGKHYLQIRGTAIGTKLAVGFANNYVAFFERLYVYTFHNQPMVWLRFIDDVFLIWTHGLEALLQFIEYLNTRVPSIRFTHEYSDTNVSFLDTTVKLVNNKLESDLYSKPTDSHSYLMYDSAHPQRCKDSIPYGQFLRIRRICSQECDYDRHVINLTAHFLSRGYPMSLLEEAATLVETKNRNDLIISQMEKTKKNETDKVLLITRYNPNFHDLRHIVYDNWDMLGKSPATEFLYEKRLMCAYRRPKNLRDMIVRANTPYKQGDEKSRPDWDPDKVYNMAGREIEKEPDTDKNAVSLEHKEIPK
jgi:hypothetical protein